jgi:hypothetical protein
VAEKHDFRSMQQKIPQESDFPNNRDMNPFPPWGNCGRHCKNVCSNLFAKIGFCNKKRFSLKSDRETANFPNNPTAKIGCLRIITSKNSWQFLHLRLLGFGKKAISAV